MNTSTIRQKFLDFFGQRQHVVKDSFSMIPQDDPTLLFISAGMAPFKPYFLGMKTDIKRAATCQKCFRTTDIENVGYTTRHQTFFEMLGNFSFGDYFKKEAIAWAWEFIIKEMGLPKDLLYISLHHTDDEALQIWHRDIGVPMDHLIKLGDKDNFWTIGVGPSGPCSEIYIDQGPSLGCGQPSCAPGCDCPRYLEFWNLVFTQYNRAEDGTLTPLEKKNIDTGMGLERLAAIMQGKTDNFDNDVFVGIIKHVEEIAGRGYQDSPQVRTAMRFVGDHIRALSIALSDGAMPGNEGRSYVLRKILRRAARFGYRYLGQDKPFLHSIVPTVARIMDVYPEVQKNIDHVTRVIHGEEERFLVTLKTGTDMLNDLLSQLKKQGVKELGGSQAFLLHDTYGFPLDLTREICREEGIIVDEKAFQSELEKQRERGRANVVSAFANFSEINPASFPETNFTGYETFEGEGRVLEIVDTDKGSLVITDVTPFYATSGGQVGDIGLIRGKNGGVFRVEATEKIEHVTIHRGTWESGRFAKTHRVTLSVDVAARRAIMRNHTTTHLLHKALQEILGAHVKQAGSHVATDRMRFDFTHFESISRETLAEIEHRVNLRILDAMPVQTKVTTYDDAVKNGAMALFGEKYGDRVRMVGVGQYSRELCGGTHVSNSAEAGFFAILSEASVAAGVRRIEAVTGEAAYHRFEGLRQEMSQLAKMLDCAPQALLERTAKVCQETEELKKELQELRKKDVKDRLKTARDQAKTFGRLQAILLRADGLTMDEMKDLADQLLDGRENLVALLAGGGEKANFVLKATKDLVAQGFHAGKLIKDIAKEAGGSGGGKSELATAGGKEPGKIDAAMKAGEAILTAWVPGVVAGK